MVRERLTPWDVSFRAVVPMFSLLLLVRLALAGKAVWLKAIAAKISTPAEKRVILFPVIVPLEISRGPCWYGGLKDRLENRVGGQADRMRHR